MNTLQNCRAIFSRHFLLALSFSSIVLSLSACEPPGVGDPCIPEAVPQGGFIASEIFIETRSLQCRTRVCMVYKLKGDPRLAGEVGSECPNPDLGQCPTLNEVEKRVYCTCRCSGPSTTELCDCPSGFRCEDEILKLGGDGIRGGYCVRNDTTD